MVKKEKIIDLPGAGLNTNVNTDITSQRKGSNAAQGRTLRAIVNGINDKSLIFSMVEEDKGGLDQLEDEYSKYDPEPDADQFSLTQEPQSFIQG